MKEVEDRELSERLTRAGYGPLLETIESGVATRKNGSLDKRKLAKAMCWSEWRAQQEFATCKALLSEFQFRFRNFTHLGDVLFDCHFLRHLPPTPIQYSCLIPYHEEAKRWLSDAPWITVAVPT